MGKAGFGLSKQAGEEVAKRTTITKQEEKDTCACSPSKETSSASSLYLSLSLSGSLPSLLRGKRGRLRQDFGKNFARNVVVTVLSHQDCNRPWLDKSQRVVLLSILRVLDRPCRLKISAWRGLVEAVVCALAGRYGLALGAKPSLSRARKPRADVEMSGQSKKNDMEAETNANASLPAGSKASSCGRRCGALVSGNV